MSRRTRIQGTSRAYSEERVFQGRIVAILSRRVVQGTPPGLPGIGPGQPIAPGQAQKGLLRQEQVHLPITRCSTFEQEEGEQFLRAGRTSRGTVHRLPG